MMTEQFVIKAKRRGSSKVTLRLQATVESTESCMESKISDTKNTLFDMLRSLGYDADKIEFGTSKE